MGRAAEVQFPVRRINFKSQRSELIMNLLTSCLSIEQYLSSFRPLSTSWCSNGKRPAIASLNYKILKRIAVQNESNYIIDFQLHYHYFIIPIMCRNFHFPTNPVIWMISGDTLSTTSFIRVKRLLNPRVTKCLLRWQVKFIANNTTNSRHLRCFSFFLSLTQNYHHTPNISATSIGLSDTTWRWVPPSSCWVLFPSFLLHQQQRKKNLGGTQICLTRIEDR